MRADEFREFNQQQLASRHRSIRELQNEAQDTLRVVPRSRVARLWYRMHQRILACLPGADRMLLDRMDASLTHMLYVYLQVLEANPGSVSLRETLHRQQAASLQAQRSLRVLRGRL